MRSSETSSFSLTQRDKTPEKPKRQRGGEIVLSGTTSVEVLNSELAKAEALRVVENQNELAEIRNRRSRRTRNEPNVDEQLRMAALKAATESPGSGTVEETAQAYYAWLTQS